MSARKVPPGARHLRTYRELESYLADFVNGIYPFIWVAGRPGVGKTESVRSAVKRRRACYRKGGQLTPASFYVDCYRHRGQPLILDDADHILDHKVGARLVSALGDTTEAKLLSYGTTSRVLGDVPPQFYTGSPLCIIANRATAFEDIQSRAVTLYFDPTNPEVHRAVARWFWNQPVFDYIGQHVHRLPPLDTRWYLTADRDHRAGRDWRGIFLSAHAQDKASSVVQDLETDPAYPTREAKAEAFVELMAGGKGASRPSYFRLRRRLEGEGRLAVEAAPPIRLHRTRPPAAPSLLELEAMGAAPPAP